MSSRKQSLGSASIGLGKPYRDILELVHDKEQMEVPDALKISRNHIRKDESGQWIIDYGQGRGQPWGVTYHPI
jgi:hypothetical protein